MMATMQDDLVRWLAGELESRGWSIRELARRAGLSHTTVAQVLSEQRKPTWEFCRSIAEALSVPDETVLRLAGLLPTRPTKEQMAEVQKVAEMLASLPDGPIREQAMTSIIAIAKDAMERAQARGRDKEATSGGQRR